MNSGGAGPFDFWADINKRAKTGIPGLVLGTINGNIHAKVGPGPLKNLVPENKHQIHSMAHFDAHETRHRPALRRSRRNESFHFAAAGI